LGLTISAKAAAVINVAQSMLAAARIWLQNFAQITLGAVQRRVQLPNVHRRGQQAENCHENLHLHFPEP
jgi:hypothetical protein